MSFLFLFGNFFLLMKNSLIFLESKHIEREKIPLEEEVQQPGAWQKQTATFEWGHRR